MQPTSTKYPLFSFLLICYNQEAYIAEALLSALDQDYPNLEIIVSDDCSKDQTFEIAKKIAQSYEGPHKIILNQNSKNLGIGANFYKAYTFSSGEWLFMAAGDDISYKNRSKSINEILKNSKNIYAIGSPREIIDKVGNSKGYCYWNDTIHGASAVWHRKLFSEFDPIPTGLMTEDHLLTFRAFLLGNVLQLGSATIKYRIDGNTLSNNFSHSYLGGKKYALKKSFLHKKILCRELYDLNSYSKKKSCKFYDELKDLLLDRRLKIENEIEFFKLIIGIFTSDSFKECFLYLKNSNAKGYHLKLFYRLFLISMKYKLADKILKVLMPEKYKNPYNNFSKIQNHPTRQLTIEDYLAKRFGIF